MKLNALFSQSPVLNISGPFMETQGRYSEDEGLSYSLILIYSLLFLLFFPPPVGKPISWKKASTVESVFMNCRGFINPSVMIDSWK